MYRVVTQMKRLLIDDESVSRELSRSSRLYSKQRAALPASRSLLSALSAPIF